MNDETKPDTATADNIDQPVVDPRLKPLRFNPLPDDTAPPTETAQVRLRALEDRLFGADCVRIRGQVERGYGSKFKEMTEPQAAHYAALEKLVETETHLADAHTALLNAEVANEAALADASKTEAEIDAPAHE